MCFIYKKARLLQKEENTPKEQGRIFGIGNIKMDYSN